MARKGKYVALAERVRQRWPDKEPDALIREGRVMVAGAIVTNPTARVPATVTLKLRRNTVPRGYLKLNAALEGHPRLSHGARRRSIKGQPGVARRRGGAGIRARYGQLLGRLRSDQRVVNLERTNLAVLDRRLIPEPIGLITMDLSYLSLAAAAPQLMPMAAGSELVVLIKPMYELGLSSPPSDPAVRAKAVEVAVAGLERCGWALAATMESPIRGNRGAVEHVAHLHVVRNTGHATSVRWSDSSGVSRELTR